MNVLVLSPHPDDDVLGMGGTMIQHRKNGDAVHVTYITSGERGVPGEPADRVLVMREAEAGVAAQITGAGPLMFWREPDGGFKATTDHRRMLMRYLESQQIDLVYAPPLNDSHPDHIETARLASYVCRRANIPLQYYETWTPITRPVIMHDITAEITAKRAAINCHQSQMLRNPFLEAMTALNHYRGLMLKRSMYAEVFGIPEVGEEQ